MIYNYEKEIKADIIAYLKDRDISLDEYNIDSVYDELFSCDSVTGNGSGSYTFNYVEARDYVLCNIGELKEACDNFGVADAELGRRFLNEEWEWMDVTIRCNLLSSVLYDMID